MSKPTDAISLSSDDTNNTTTPGLLTRTEPLSPSVLASIDGLDATKAVCCEVDAGGELYCLVSDYIAARAARSFSLGIGSGARHCCDSDDEDGCEEATRVASKKLGLGRFSFDHDGQTIHAVHSTLGEVVGTNCGPAIMRTLVLVTDRSVELLTSFCDMLIAKADETSDRRFSIFRWHVQHQYWRKAETAKARPVESVVLPAELKAKVVEDMSEFVSKDTKEWYQQHGVPYKRSYLLHGSPGAGKTSLIQALAGRFKRNVCYLSSLSHPEFTDDAMKAAVQRVPARSILVLEDVDALFEAGRTKRAGDKSPLTFSGVLNALDGVGASTGQIFILTTNHRERLDPALIRNGRVDVHVKFSDATKEQMRMLFSSFYKGAAPGLDEAFASNLCELLGERTVSMAQLQHYFVGMRKKGAAHAAAEVKLVLEEAEAHGLTLAKKEQGKGGEADGKQEAKTGKGDADGKGAAKKGEAEADEASEEEEEAPKPAKGKKAKKGAGVCSKEVHVHVHVD